MDLGAFVQISDLDEVAKKNGIEVPRLRGYRLMKGEEPFSQDEIARIIRNCGVKIVEELCCTEPFWSTTPSFIAYNDLTDYYCKRFLVKDKDGNYIDIRWDRIHGRKRKMLKYAIKKMTRRIKAQLGLWNKYAGQDRVFYIHSRMGGSNWDYYERKGEITNSHWFLDRVDDWWDSSYCDFYARIQ